MAYFVYIMGSINMNLLDILNNSNYVCFEDSHTFPYDGHLLVSQIWIHIECIIAVSTGLRPVIALFCFDFDGLCLCSYIILKFKYSLATNQNLSTQISYAAFESPICALNASQLKLVILFSLIFGNHFLPLNAIHSLNQLVDDCDDGIDCTLIRMDLFVLDGQ
jgi:hypothetical protein